MKIKESGLYQGPDPEGPLDVWYANIIYIDRRKCLMCVHGSTSISFLVADISVQELKQFPVLFNGHLKRLLTLEGIPNTVVETATQDIDFSFAKSQSKSVLGSMNDLALNYWSQILESAKQYSSLDEVIHDLNRTPMGALGYAYPIEKLKDSIHRG